MPATPPTCGNPRAAAAEIAPKNIRVISNAGGSIPAPALPPWRRREQAGVQLKIAVLHGDNLQPKLGELAKAGTLEMFNRRCAAALLCLGGQRLPRRPGIVEA